MNEADRLRILESFEILDSAPEAQFDEITQLVSQLCEVPIALISLVDEARQWFKSRVGIDTQQTPREVAFCAHAIQQSDLMVVEDAAADPRFSGNPLVVGPPNIRFYAGMALASREGAVIGTLCAIDRRPRELSVLQTHALRVLGRQVMARLELKRALTESQRLAQDNRLSADRFRSLALATAQIVWTTNAQGEVVEDSPSWRAFTGQTLLHRAGGAWLDAIHPDDRDRAVRAWSEALETRMPYEVEYRLRRADGVYRETSARGTPVLDEGGGVREWVGCNTDVTEKKAAVEALKRSEESFRLLSEAVPAMVWTADPEGKITYVNRQTVEYTGSSSESLLGAGWAGAVHADDLPGTADRWSHSIRTGEKYEVEHRVHNGDGRYRWHLTRAIPMRLDAQVQKWFGTSTDIEAQKQAEQQAAELAHFHQTVLGIAGHDLRNPLSAISHTAAHLLKAELPGGATKGVARIANGAKRATRILDALFDFTRAQLGGRIQLSVERVDLHALGSELIQEFDASEAGAGRTLRHEVQGDAVGQWDRSRLGQLVANLIGNALQYSPSGTAVTLRTRGAGSTAIIEVENEGPPIASQVLPTLFEPFRRGESPNGGSRHLGLGLYIVRQIATAHGGEVSVRSDEVEGTLFTVQIPKAPFVSGADELFSHE